MSECIAAFQRVNCAEILRIGVLFKFKSLMSSFCAIRTMLKYVTFISGQSLSLFLDAPPPLDPRCHLHLLYMYVTTFHCLKGILSSWGGVGGEASKPN